MAEGNLRSSHWGNKEQRAQRQARALAMRLEGQTLKAIAEEIGVSINAVWVWCKQYTDQCKEEAKADAWRILMRDWELTETAIDGVLEDVAAGNTDAVNSLIKILDRRSKYRGLDAAQKYEMSVKEVPSREAFDSELEDTIREMEALESGNGSADDVPILGELEPDDDYEHEGEE